MPVERNILFSTHALEQIRHRRLDLDLVLAVALRPGQPWPTGEGREVRQDIIRVGPHPYLLRVIVDLRIGIEIVVTAYKTTKFHQYGDLP
jgi:hypothetical protein